MGLLDDAIREHLELKRVRGADPSEVIRQEREVLDASAPRETAAPEPDGSGANGEEHAAPVGATAAQEAAPLGAPETPQAIEEAPRDERFQSTAAPVGVAREEVAPPTPSRTEAVEQETAEVDIQAMLGVEDEADVGAEGSAAPFGVTRGPGDRQQWGAPPDAASG